MVLPLPAARAPPPPPPPCPRPTDAPCCSACAPLVPFVAVRDGELGAAAAAHGSAGVGPAARPRGPAHVGAPLAGELRCPSARLACSSAPLFTLLACSRWWLSARRCALPTCELPPPHASLPAASPTFPSAALFGRAAGGAVARHPLQVCFGAAGLAPLGHVGARHPRALAQGCAGGGRCVRLGVAPPACFRRAVPDTTEACHPRPCPPMAPLQSACVVSGTCCVPHPPPQVFERREWESLLARSIAPKLAAALQELVINPLHQARALHVSSWQYNAQCTAHCTAFCEARTEGGHAAPHRPLSMPVLLHTAKSKLCTTSPSLRHVPSAPLLRLRSWSRSTGCWPGRTLCRSRRCAAGGRGGAAPAAAWWRVVVRLLWQPPAQGSAAHPACAALPPPACSLPPFSKLISSPSGTLCCGTG